MQILNIDVPVGNKCIEILILSDGISNEVAIGKEIELLKYLVLREKQLKNELLPELSDWLNSLQKKNGDDKSLMLLIAERGGADAQHDG